MTKLFCIGVAVLLLVSGCGTGTPTRHNDFVPLTSIEIQGAPSIAVHTSTALRVIGNYSGQFTRDITGQAAWSSDTPAVAGFVTAASPNRVTGLSPGSAVLTASVGGIATTFNLTVTSATVTAVAVAPAAPTVAAGVSLQFAASGTFTDGTTQDLTFDATWASGDATVATVGDTAADKGLAHALAPGTAAISATFGGQSGSSLLTVTQVALQSITVTPATPSILSVSTGQFTATGHYSDGSTADITGQAIWNSSQPGVATVAAGGKATTLAQGTTTITATLDGVSGVSNLKVTGGSLTRITLSVPARLVAGTVGTMTATGSFSNGSARDITGAVGWSVVNTNVASVTTPGGNVALLNGSLAGSTTVKATFGSVTDSASLTVAAPQPTNLAISLSTPDLNVGASSILTATATFSDGTNQDVSENTIWSSSAPASVDNTSPVMVRLRGTSAGIATITASYGGITRTVQVTVKTRTLTLFTVSNFPAVTLNSGNQTPFTATATYSDGTTLDVTEDVGISWAVGNADVAVLADSVNHPGQVIAVDTGSTTLMASFGGKSQNVTITVP